MILKKLTVFIIFLLLLIISTISLCIVTYYTNKQIELPQDQTIQVSEFSLSNYWAEVFDFHYEKNVGQITAPEIAIEKAKMVWQEKFGKYYVDNNDPITVSYDTENECWLVKEILEGKNVVGATPHILIKTDGRVLAVWYG